MVVVSAPSFRLPFIVLGAVLLWLVVGEIATQAWYAFQESKHAPTQPWNIQWPTEKDAARRGFIAFKERPLTDAEKETLWYEKGHAGTWISPEGAQWTGFYFEWSQDYRLNQLDLLHNPTTCLPAAGLTLVGSLPDTTLAVGSSRVDVHGWEFESNGKQVYVFVATRWVRDFDPFSYRPGLWLSRLGNFWRAIVGNRGFRSAVDAAKGLETQIAQMSSSNPN